MKIKAHPARFSTSILKQGEPIKINPTALDGCNVRYKLHGSFATVKTDTINICRDSGAGWIVLLESGITYPLKAFKYIDILKEKEL